MILFQNTLVIPDNISPFPNDSGYFWNRILDLLCESVNLPSTQNQWIRKPKLHIFDTALQNRFFLYPDGFWWIRVDDWNSGGGEGRGGGGWIQIGYTTLNSSRRNDQVFGFRKSGFVFTWPKNVYMNWNRWRCLIVTITEVTQRQLRRQRERQKSNKLRLASLYSLLCRHCSTTTWNSLISPFMEDVNTKQRYSLCRYPKS